MLRGKLSLHGIEDVEAFVASFLQRGNLEPPAPWTKEEFLADLVSYVWELSLEFDGSQGSRFSAWAKYKLNHESVNWIRRKRGRTKWQFATHTYERELPSFVELDGDTPLGPPTVDPAERGDSDDERVFAAGGISAAAYLPPAGLRSVGGVHGPRDCEADRDECKDRAAA